MARGRKMLDASRVLTLPFPSFLLLGFHRAKIPRDRQETDGTSLNSRGTFPILPQILLFKKPSTSQGTDPVEQSDG